MNEKCYYGIQAWGKLMGSTQYYIDSEIIHACSTNAPETAIYVTKKEWVTVENITVPEIKQQIETSIAQLKQDAEKPGWNE